MMQARRPRPPRRKVPDGRRRYKVHMVRHLPGGKKTRAKVITTAWSKDQAERFAAIRKPGFSVTRVEED